MLQVKAYLDPDASRPVIEKLIAESNRGFVNKVGDLLEDNTIKRREKLKNMQFIFSFSDAEIIAAYNTVAMNANANKEKLQRIAKLVFPLVLKAVKIIREELKK